MADQGRSEARECFSVDKDGKKVDAWIHAELLGSEAADRFVSEQAVRRAIKRGVKPDSAKRMYGYRPKSESDII
jgi:hypothetical protein